MEPIREAEMQTGGGRGLQLGQTLVDVLLRLGYVQVLADDVTEGVQTFLKCTPVLYGTSMLRSVMTAHASETLFADFGTELSETVAEEYAREMGVTVSFGDEILPVWGEVAIILICGIILAGAAVIVARRKRFSDR